MRQKLIPLLSGLFVALLTGCTDGAEPIAPSRVSPVSPNVAIGGLSIRITGGPASLVVGQQAPYTAVATDIRGRAIPPGEVTWFSSRPGVVRMNGNVATALKPGTSTVFAAFYGGVAERQVTVTVAPPKPAVWAWRNAAAAPANTRGIYATLDAGRREVLIVTSENKIVVYRIADDSWSELPVSGMPTPAGEYQIAYDDASDRILLEWRGLGSVYAIPRNGGAAVAVGNNANGSSYFDHVFGLNPVTNQLFVMAGYGFFAFHNTLWQFSAGNQWTAQTVAAPLPWPRQAPSASVAKSQRSMYLFGGEGNASGSQYDSYTRLHSLWRFDFATSTWTSLIEDNLTIPSTAPAGRHAGLAATPTGSAVYMYGPEVSPPGVPFQSIWRLRPGTDGAFALMPTSGPAPATTQFGMTFYDAQSQDLVLIMQDAPLQTFRVRVQ